MFPTADRSVYHIPEMVGGWTVRVHETEITDQMAFGCFSSGAKWNSGSRPVEPVRVCPFQPLQDICLLRYFFPSNSPEIRSALPSRSVTKPSMTSEIRWHIPARTSRPASDGRTRRSTFSSATLPSVSSTSSQVIAASAAHPRARCKESIAL